MPISHQRPQRTAIVPILCILLLCATNILAQGLPKLTDQAGTDAKSDTSVAVVNTESSSEGATSAATDGTATTSSDVSNTLSSSAATDQATPTTSDATTTSDAPGLTGLPKLAGDNYPPPTVPPTADAPFMQKSSLPEGTVFIAVGAGLGLMGAIVLAWRGFMAWSVHRSVQESAAAHSAHHGTRATSRKSSNMSKYAFSSSEPGSSVPLDYIDRGVQPDSRKSSKVDPKSASARASLFFSPTADAGLNTQARNSSYHPAGYYASGAAVAGGGAILPQGGSVRNSLAQIEAPRQRYSSINAPAPSPPRSPSRDRASIDSRYEGSQLSTMGIVGRHDMNTAPTGRAPSTYLEDLFSNGAPDFSREGQRPSRR